MNMITFRNFQNEIKTIKENDRLDHGKEIGKIPSLKEVFMIVENIKLSIILNHALPTPGLTDIKFVLKIRTYFIEFIRKMVRDLIYTYFYKGIQFLNPFILM